MFQGNASNNRLHKWKLKYSLLDLYCTLFLATAVQNDKKRLVKSIKSIVHFNQIFRLGIVGSVCLRCKLFLSMAVKHLRKKPNHKFLFMFLILNQEEHLPSPHLQLEEPQLPPIPPPHLQFGGTSPCKPLITSSPLPFSPGKNERKSFFFHKTEV